MTKCDYCGSEEEDVYSYGYIKACDKCAKEPKVIAEIDADVELEGQIACQDEMNHPELKEGVQ